MNKTVAAAYMLTLADLDNLALASLTNAVSGFGRVDKTNHGYRLALDNDLIREDGTPVYREELEVACLAEINRRLNEGRLA